MTYIWQIKVWKENQIDENVGTTEDVSNESIYQAEVKVYNTNNELVTVEDDKIDMVNIGIDELHEKIEEMLEKQGSFWTCKICGKSLQQFTGLVIL